MPWLDMAWLAVVLMVLGGAAEFIGVLFVAEDVTDGAISRQTTQMRASLASLPAGILRTVGVRQKVAVGTARLGLPAVVFQAEGRVEGRPTHLGSLDQRVAELETVTSQLGRDLLEEQTARAELQSELERHAADFPAIAKRAAQGVMSDENLRRVSIRVKSVGSLLIGVFLVTLGGIVGAFA